MTHRLVSLHALFAAAALLAACGGGGDPAAAPPPPPPPPPATYDVARAWQNLLTSTRSWSVSGIGSDGNSYALVLAFAPAAASAFPYTGMVGPRADVRTTVSVNGTAEPTFESRLYYAASTFGVFGEHAVTDSSCSTATAGAALPTAAVPGATGLLYDANDYDSCIAPATLDGTTNAAWSLENDSGNVLFCVNFSERSVAGALLGTSSSCLQTATDGTLGAAARVTFTEGSLTVTMRN